MNWWFVGGCKMVVVDDNGCGSLWVVGCWMVVCWL